MERPIKAEESTGSNGKRGARIVVVEDDVGVAMLLKARLESFGHQICEIVRTGQEAIAGALRHKPDLILMDIFLEDEMDGIQAAEHITKQLDVPIIYLSCLSDPEMLDRAVKTNPYGYLVKPYDHVELRLSIELAVTKHQAARERENLILKLEEALREVKKLSGLLPICAACKKIRDDQGRWHGIEAYIASHSEADFSHGICPECSQKLYPELYDGTEGLERP